MCRAFFSSFCCCQLTFFKINFFKKKIFQEYYQGVKQFGFQIRTDRIGSRSWLTFCQSWSGSKRFAKVIFFGLAWFSTSQSTAMVMLGRPVHLTTLFPGQAWLSSSPVLYAHTFAWNWQQPFLIQRKGGEWLMINLYKSMGPCAKVVCSWQKSLLARKELQ